jgi:trehalose 6-phosphate phosphatase
MQNPHPSAPFDHNYALFLDVDGTLADFREDPADVWLSESLLSLLSSLRDALHGALVLVSGRTVEDLDRMIGDRPLCCVGLHGLSHNAHCPLPSHASSAAAGIDALRDACRDFVQQYPGVLLEDKGLGFALHFRRNPQLATTVQEFARQSQQRFARHAGIELLEGKMVMEFRPAGASKGAAVRQLLAQLPFRARVPVFIGDDVTDEDGFVAVNSAGGVSIKCGAGESCATYHLHDVAAVHSWLAQYLDFLLEV